MKPPKLLPWIARKAGITDDLALKLWRRAASESETSVGNASSSEYFGRAVELFLNLVEDEARLERETTAPALGWMWRYQKRMALHSLTTSQAVFRCWDRLRRRAQGPGFTAH